MPDEWKTTSAEALLGLLSLGPQSGYELKQLIGESIGNFWSESYGQIYPTLKRLEQDGLVAVAEGDRAGSKIYSLTQEGREQLRTWLSAMPRPQIPRNELLLKLFLGNLSSPSVLREQVLAQRRSLEADLERYTWKTKELKRDYPGAPELPFWLMTLRHGVLRAEALLRWCDETLETLAQLGTAGDNEASHPQLEEEMAR